VTAIVAGLACAPGLAATPAAATGPWAQVPALTTACYSDKDPWPEKNDAAFNALQESLHKQQEANTAVEQKSNKALSENQMALAQAMQQAMMDDPANAQKLIEKMTNAGQQAQTEVPAQLEREKQVEDESKAVLKQYDAALLKALAPATARWTALKTKRGYSADAMAPSETGEPDWVYAEWLVILKERDSGYAANCAQWWSAAGPIHAYMKRYKDFLVQERIPYERKLIDQPKLDQFKLLSVPADGWRTTTDFDAAVDYMKMAANVFGHRAAWPLCREETYCK
jgi:hypothetical protein